ncbi:hypothetical protein EDC05_000631 [Coemansia umbellata]|uniref:Uncharacterized protein n=1 Tax=Coemansia umbellata TaxID=1424467 RepID=A0ABQ8PTX5_9FUNG|nr:hypothetical protein EDC05_000631 [Coemansia umbellata]
MKVTNTIFALAYAALGAASGVNYAGSAPASSAPAAPTPAPQAPPAATTVQSIPMTPVPIVIADFIYSPASPSPMPMLPTPAMSSAQSSVPVPAYTASPVPAAPTSVVAPAEPPAEPAPTSTQRKYISNKRDVDQSSMNNLVNGSGAMVFDVDGKSYMLLRLPLDMAKKVADSKVTLRKRASEGDLLSDATTKDLDSDALLYDLLGKVFARVILPVKTNIGISNPEDSNGVGNLLRRDLLDNILGEVVASAVAPINVVANINPDEDGDGLVPNLLGRVSATVQASPTVTLHIFDSDKNGSDELLRRDLVEDLLGEVVASAVAPINVVANINPDEDGNGLVPNLLGRVSATVQASPTVTLHLFDTDKDNSDELMRRDLLDNILGEVVASAVAPINVVANINPDEDGDGLVPNLLGRVSATIQASPTVTLHIFDSDKNGSDELLRRDLVEDLLGEVVASAVAPINVVANINPDEDGNGLVPNLLGRVSATVQASPTVTLHLFDTDKDSSDELMRRDLLDNILGEVVASAVAPVNIVANINPDEDGDGLVPNLLGRVSATVQASPTVTLHIFDSDKNGSDELLRRDLVEDLLGEVVASAVAPLNVVANINPDEDGNGLVPNLLGRVSATVQASPTVTLHLFDTDKDSSDELMRRDLLDNILGEVVASAVAPVNIVANINPDEDGDGLVPNLLGRVSATIQASPTVTLHIFDSDEDESENLLKRDTVPNGIYTERVDDTHVAIYVPLSTFTKGISQPNVASLISEAGSDKVQIVSMTPTPTKQMSSAPTPAATSIQNDIYLRIVVPKSSLL